MSERMRVKALFHAIRQAQIKEAMCQPERRRFPGLNMQRWTPPAGRLKKYRPNRNRGVNLKRQKPRPPVGGMSSSATVQADEKGSAE